MSIPSGTDDMRLTNRRQFLRAAAITAVGSISATMLPSLAFGAAAWGTRRRNPATMNVIALGDSIVWGQGLAASQKFTTQAQAFLAGRMGVPVTLTSFARSGAVLSPGGIGNEPICAVAGEVPDDFPSIRRQAAMAAGLPLPFGCNTGVTPLVPRDEVDVIIVDGGINDVDVGTILNPMPGAPPIDSSAVYPCGEGMRRLLEDICLYFPNAKVVVTGYYPIVSAESDVTLVLDLATAINLFLPPGNLLALLPGVVAANLVERCRQFYDLSTAAIRAAVQNVDGLRGPGRIAFADPGFGPRNAYGAPARWLFNVGEQDPARDGRIASCRGVWGEPSTSNAPDAQKCWNASMGHPNILGANAYARAVNAALSGLFQC